MPCNRNPRYTTHGYPAMSTARRTSTGRWRPWSRRARLGGIELLHNTNIDSNNQLYLDGRGRAGRYVLMRALTSSGVSSACPDDIDAANGWNPTDIHIRTYSERRNSHERWLSE
jgi:aminomethyltransferase